MFAKIILYVHYIRAFSECTKIRVPANCNSSFILLTKMKGECVYVYLVTIV